MESDYLYMRSVTASYTVMLLLFFFFNAMTTSEIYTLSLHDALPISRFWSWLCTFIADIYDVFLFNVETLHLVFKVFLVCRRSEEHTSELQSRRDLVCRLLLEKKKC